MATASVFSVTIISKHIVSVVKHKHSGTPSVMDWHPQSLDHNITEAVWIKSAENGTKGSKHPKKSFGCPSNSLENYFWRLLKEMRREFRLC